MSVTFHFQKPVHLPHRRKLKQLVTEVFYDEMKVLGSLSVIFCSNSFLLDINKSFLSHDYFTDVITFDLSDNKEIEGEIYISVDTAKENSKLYKVLLFNELTRLVVHGCLHLCGYKDNSLKEKSKMSHLENRYLKKFEIL